MRSSVESRIHSLGICRIGFGLCCLPPAAKKKRTGMVSLIVTPADFLFLRCFLLGRLLLLERDFRRQLCFGHLEPWSRSKCLAVLTKSTAKCIFTAFPSTLPFFGLEDRSSSQITPLSIRRRKRAREGRRPTLSIGKSLVGGAGRHD